ncbi:hypothetical protein MPTK1_5g07040 [Marchantia polymorpha subsp. ruderalis]|nr:hypothetical protein MARPO_0136s0017 [Marchantia polymorpha]BBN10861.1 hypothetical protein Mp_5g07040 [Marchantia polymorpha subsp. ruderalis]|eukprot:PTQ29689.1 hypothetical protein MARPO_0136s0017 [Marchantia polymorpha]
MLETPGRGVAWRDSYRGDSKSLATLIKGRKKKVSEDAAAVVPAEGEDGPQDDQGPTTSLEEAAPASQEFGADAESRNPNMKTTTIAVTFSCECATRRAVEVDGMELGGELLPRLISREICDDRKIQNNFWPRVRLLGDIRRGIQYSKSGKAQKVVIQSNPASPSTASKWVVDTINKISGSLHCEKSLPD